ncbi:alpha-protein kinase 1-like [Diorhabda carinulata]|uniref:alpha-protein kinase 1-like n=1 Tax=Diorhabda carinulata TaxID=1163345 RepID=UPI0025A27E78|nr:alpha-protein kinase 1-like [Diorhabda carinulata]XP_057653986.1 alpha-protein kinase 1-like [Diorhabda carinulata]
MSQTPHKPLQKMCKSPKISTYQTIKQEKIEYENLSTNCTVVGSNNLNLVKKPQIVTSVSPAYSNPSPVYPPSPYSSPASLKSPSPSLKPPTPQPNFPVMQIIQNNILARPIQTSQPQNIIKLKPHLNILPKPSASPQPSPKPSLSPQIVLPTNHQQTATIVPTAQPLLLNQMPMLTTPSVQFILRPQTATKLQPQMQTATATPQGLILQPGGQQLLQIQPPRSQPMVRVLTNGMQLTPSSTTTYVTQVGTQQPNTASHLTQQTLVNNTQAQHVVQHQQLKKKPKNKVKKKLDLANIMKLSGIGDEDDIQFESDTSQSESEHNSVPTTPQPQHTVHSTVQAQTNFVHTDTKKNIQNIQISAMAQPTINATTPVVQVLNQNFQSGMISNSSSQAATAQASIPFNSFITPNFTINNGLMLQRSGGFKLTMGDDGRLILQHDPTINTDLQSQIILQSLLGGLVLQPSMDQQTVQQTVQTIQQQSVQTIQQQTVQSQTIQTVQQQTVQPQTVQHTIQSLQPQIQQQTVQQTIQHQTVNALQQPMQIVQPQPIQSIHSQAQPLHSISQSQVHSLQSQIQGQLQSLLQQQNHTVQHSNVPTQNVHSQTVQSVQNVQSMQQNLQNLQQNVQSVQQNIQSVQQNVRSVQQNVQSLQQNIQSIPQQTLQQPAQNFHTNHSHPQNQPVLKVQPFQKSQPPVQTVQPIQHHISNQQQSQQQQQQHQQQNLRENQQNQNNNAPQPASYVVNLTPDQLEQLKRNGQLTVNGQTIFMQRPNKDQLDKKISPKSKTTKKVNKIQSIKNILHETENEPVKASNNSDPIKENVNKSVDSALNAPPPKQTLPQNHVQPQPLQQTKPVQPHALVQPSIQVQPKTIPDRSKSLATPAVSQIPKQQKVAPTIISQDSNGVDANPDVDKILVQILEESNMSNVPNSTSATAPTSQPHQRITTIQLTPQKQQQLKNIQHQIQSLSARLTPGDVELQNTLKMLFTEQQKILASGKLLPMDKVHYHNNQLTIMNPSALNPSPPTPVKSESIEALNFGPALNNSQNTSRNTTVETPTTTRYQPITTPAHSAARISVSVPCSETTATQTIHHLPSPLPQNIHQTTSHFTHISHSVSSHQIPAISLSSLHSISSHPPISSHPNITTHQQQHQPQHGTISNSNDTVTQNHLPTSHCSSGIHQSTTHNVVSSHQVSGNAPNHLHYNHIVNQRFNCPQPIQQISMQQQQIQRQQLMHKKANIIETQLTMDQNGATKPDIHTPFKDKKDACIRLIRYHCLDQPVLSEKDLDKADEIFELTAQHLISKFSRMEDKYKYLLMKESMRQVQTSEMMMLDRMFLTDEQQSLMKLRQDYENELLNIPSNSEQEMPQSLPPPPPQPPPPPSQSTTHTSLSTSTQNAAVSSSEPSSEDYDEWACIQRELGCLPQHIETKLSQHNHPKRSASTDSRLETLKRFRVDKHHKKSTDVNLCGVNSIGNSAPSTIYHQQSKASSGSSTYDSAQNCSFSSHEDNEPENNSIDEQVQSAIDSILNLQQTPSLDLDSILS